MCAQSVWGLVDWRRESLVDDVCWAWRSLGLLWPLSVSPWKTTRRAACGCGAGNGLGSVSPGSASAFRLASLRCEDCLGPSAGRAVGDGLCTCQRGNPLRVVSPGGVSESYGPPPAWVAPGPLGTVVAGGLGRALLARGSRDVPDVVPLHGCTDAQGCALVPLPV